mgnify:CR=1 FL=1
MEELSIEEKANRYNEALEIAKKNYITAQDLCEGSTIGVECFKNTLENIFPELKENEDEKIKKELTEFLKSAAGGFLDTAIQCKTFGKWAAWIEKQVKQKNKINLYKITFEDVLALECAMKTVKITKDGKELYEMLVLLYNKIHNIYLTERQYKQEYVWNEEDIFKVQGKQEQLYIRFGEIPTDEKSKIYQGEKEVGIENGVSVYPAFKTNEGDIVLGLNLPITKTTLYTQQHLIEYDNRPCYLVKGDYVGKDTDGQPLITNVSIIEKIDNYRAKEKKQGEQKHYIMEDKPDLRECFNMLYQTLNIMIEEYSKMEGFNPIVHKLKRIKEKIGYIDIDTFDTLI